MVNKIYASLRARFKHFWDCLINTGINGNIVFHEIKFVRFTNVVAVLTAVAVFAYIPVSIFHKQYLLAGLQCVDTLLVLAVLWVNHLQYHRMARHFYMLVINSFVLVNAYFIGYQSHVHDFFYISYVVPFLLFSVRDYRNIIVGVVVAIVFFNIYERTNTFFTHYNLDAATQHSIYEINLWMKFVLFGLAIYIMAHYNFESENNLKVLNERLNKQAEEMKRSNEDLEQFAYIISHDLKTPVRSIASFIKLATTRSADALTAESREFLGIAKESAERLSRQIDDLLSYSKLGRDLPPETEVDINELVTSLQMEFGEKLLERHTKLMIETGLPVLTGVHSSMVYHIFRNLIANAIKFNKNERPWVKVGSSVENGFLICYVKDNGIGINPEYQTKLFQMFKRLHTVDEFEGTGIGLAACKKIVNFYGGNIWLESTAGKGATFFFSLPARLVVSMEAPSPAINLVAEHPKVAFAA